MRAVLGCVADDEVHNAAQPSGGSCAHDVAKNCRTKKHHFGCGMHRSMRHARYYKVTHPFSGSTDEWVQSTFGPSGFAWPKAKCADLSSALAEEEFFTAESVAKMDDGDVAGIVQDAGLKAGSARDFKEGHAALQKAGCSVRLTLATLTGQTTIVAVRPDDTVQSIKDKAVESGVTGAAHNLMHGKEQLLETNRTVHEFGLSDGDTLHVVPVTRGMI